MSIWKTIRAQILLGVIVLVPNSAYGQLKDGLDIYSYFQVITQAWDIESNPASSPRNTTSFSVQQLNVFLRKQYDAKFSSFINLELTNSFSLSKGWGNINLEEAWGKYDHAPYFKMKFGLLIPAYNNLNKIKNRTPLLPFIYRPIAYEASFNAILNTIQLVPQQAGLEVYGTFTVDNQLRIDYSAYVGNQLGFVIGEGEGYYTPGSDTTVSKLIGSRVGLRFRGLKFGVSLANDKTTLSDIAGALLEIEASGKGTRNRFGVDLSYNAYPWFIESEYSQVKYKLDALGRRNLAEIARSNIIVNNKVDMHFFYVMVGRHFYEKYFAYAMYSYLDNEIYILMSEGIGNISLGGGMRIKDDFVLKMQFSQVSMYTDTLFYFELYNFAVGLSIFL